MSNSLLIIPDELPVYKSYIRHCVVLTVIRTVTKINSFRCTDINVGYGNKKYVNNSVGERVIEIPQKMYKYKLHTII